MPKFQAKHRLRPKRVSAIRRGLLASALPAGVQADEAVRQAGHKVLVVVAGAQHQVAVDGENPQGVQQRHLLRHRLVRPAQLVEHRAV